MGYRIIGNFSVVPHSSVDFTALLRRRHYSFFFFWNYYLNILPDIFQQVLADFISLC